MTATAARPATEDDAEFLGHVLYTTYVQNIPPGTAEPEESWAVGAIAGARDQAHGKLENSITYVIESGGRRVGRLRVVRTAERIEIAGIQIVPEDQDKGTGTAIITEILREADERGVPTVLEVNIHNPDAERLYARLGFIRGAQAGNDYRMSRECRSA